MKTNKEIANYTLAALKSAGAEHAQCRVTQGKSDEINVDNGAFSLMRTSFSSGLSIKALKENKKGTVDINRLDKAAIDEAVAQCMAAVESASPDEAEQIAPYTQNYDFVSGVLEPDRNAFFDRVEEYLSTVQKEMPLVSMEQLIATYSFRDILFANTNGVQFTQQGGSYYCSSMFSAQEGEQSSSFNSYGVMMNDLDTPIIDLGMQRTLLEDVQKQIRSISLPGKFTGPIILTPECTADFLSSLMMNFLHDSVLIDGTSPWKNKLGQKVAHDSLTVKTVPLDSRVKLGERFTGDGYRSEDVTFINNGVLESFRLSQYGANKTGLARCANTSWNMLVEPGECSLAQMVSGIKKGLLVSRFSGGNPATNGDFSGVAKNSFLIENGQIADAVSETMISGNLADMFQNVLAISREQVQDGSNILPWVAVDGITISGNA